MAAILWTDVVAVAPDMATGVSAAFQTLVLSYVNVNVVATEFGGEDNPTYVMARAYLAAHYAALHKAGVNGTAGQRIAQSEGGVSMSFANNSPMGTDPLLDKTTYGQAFRSLSRRSPSVAGFVT